MFDFARILGAPLGQHPRPFIGLIACLIAGPALAFVGPPPSAQWMKPEDLPESALKHRLNSLPLSAQENALAWLRRVQPPEQDVFSLNVDDDGGVFYQDTFGLGEIPAPSPTVPVTAEAAVPISPFPANLNFHSRPGAANVIFLNFSGDTITGTAWNDSLGRLSIPAVPFSMDVDYTTFSDTEQSAIRTIWERVAEDYALFDVDVTTERPATFTTRTAHALITRNTDANGLENPSSQAAGVAYIDVFASIGYARYRPAWIYVNQLANDESYTGEAVSHEVGHNFGLSHDGQTDGTEYYGGHGTGDTSWGPIMGLGYNRSLSQWSKGEYYLANNTQDDLAIISGKAPYRGDDVGGTIAAATPLRVTGGSLITSTTPANDPANTNTFNKGVLERPGDVDVFSFVTGSGSVDLTVNPWVVPGGYTRGGNLDSVAELYSDTGVLLLTANPSAYTFARVQTNLSEGTYYLLVRATGTGSPLSSTPSGYTSYASLGQYFISGSVTPFTGSFPPRAQLQVANITTTAAGPNSATVTYSDNATVQFSSIDSFDLRVVGPSGYDRPARFVSASPAYDSASITASYAIDPPAGSVWDSRDNGVYSVWMVTNQVSDTEGDWVPAAQLGEFSVNVPLVIYSADMSANPNWVLEPLWSYGKPGLGETGPSSGFTGENLIGYNLGGDYEPNLPLTYATTPAINCAGASGLTLKFKRWLRVRNGDTALIQISTNGVAWTDLWASSRTLADSAWIDAQYALPSSFDGTPSLRIRWGLGSGPSLQDTGWNLDDVQVLAASVIDSTPPLATLAVADVRAASDLPLALRVTYTDQTAVRINSLGTGNIAVLGPDGQTRPAAFVNVDIATDGSPRIGSYELTAPGGVWDSTDNGIYQVVLQGGSVADTSDNYASQTVLGSFLVDITQTPPLLVLGTTSIEVPEAGTAALSLKLSKAPSANVQVTTLRSSGDVDLFVVGGQTVEFTPANWSNAVPITIGASQDADHENGSATFECKSDGLASVFFDAWERDLYPVLFSLSVSPAEVGWGTTVPSGGSYESGTPLSIQAIPAPYFQFDRWEGDLSGTDNPLLVTLSQNLQLTARFAEMLTTNHPTPLWWLASNGIEGDFETAVDLVGANGLPLWESYVAGLNPNDPNDQLRLGLSPVPGLAEYILSWQAVEGRTYTIERSTQLTGGFETVLDSGLLPAGTVSLTNSVPPGSSAVFYRLKVEKP